MVANALGLAVIVLPVIDPTRPLWPVIALLLAAVGLISVWRNWPRK